MRNDMHYYKIRYQVIINLLNLLPRSLVLGKIIFRKSPKISVINNFVISLLMIISFLKLLLCILAKGGEGIILRNPKSPYEHGRSKNILKFKVFLLKRQKKRKTKNNNKKNNKNREKRKLIILKTFRDLEARIISNFTRDSKLYFTCEL